MQDVNGKSSERSSFIGLPYPLHKSFLCIVIVLVTASPFCYGQNYDKVISLEFPFVPNAFTHGDLDNDGIDDILMSFEDQDFIAIRFNSTNGFTPPKAVHLGNISKKRSIMLADIDHNDFKDILFTDETQNRIGVLLNNGNQNFAAPFYISTDFNPRKITFGDLNNDEKIELVVLYNDSDVVTILSDDQLQWENTVSSQLTLGNQPFDAIVKDMNNDGAADLIVSSKGSNTISIVYSYGTASQETVEFTVASPGNIEVEDLDNDGVLDIAIAKESSLQVIHLNLNQTLKNESVIDVDGTLSEIDFLIENLDDDTDKDIVITGSSGSSDTYLFFFIANEIGSYDLIPRNYNNILNAPFLHVGYTELYPNGNYGKGFLYANSRGVTSNLTYPKPTYEIRAVSNIPLWMDIQRLVFGDLDNDGINDMVIANRHFNFITLCLGNGNDTFEYSTNLPGGRGASRIKLVDLNLDNSLDIITGGLDPSIHLNDGQGNFTELPLEPTNGHTNDDISIHDINNDGYPDVLINGRLFINETGESFTFKRSFFSYNTKANTFIHYDHDNHIDVAVSDGNNLNIHVGDGSGDFRLVKTLDVRAYNFLVADLNSDGFDDLITNGSSRTNTITILFGTSSGFDEDTHTLSNNGFHAGINVFDFDQNGSLDLVSAENGETIYYPINSSGIPGSQKRFRIWHTGFYRNIYEYDYNRDGEMDIVATDFDGKTRILTREKMEAVIEIQDQVYDGSEIDNLILSIPPDLRYTAYHKGINNLPTDAGEYPVTIYIQDSDYMGILIDTVKVVKAPLTISVTDTTKHQNQENPEFRLRFNELLGDDTKSDIDELPQIETSATKNSEMGAYDIVLTGGNDNNYELNLVNGTLIILDPLSITNAVDVQYYPNPVHEIITIDHATLAIRDIRVSNMEGKILQLKSVDSGTRATQLNLSDYKSGLYQLIVTSRDNQVFTFKIFKN